MTAEAGSAGEVAGRIVDAIRWLGDVTSARRRPSTVGTALYHDAFPARWDSNVLRVEGRRGTIDAAEVVAECERLYAGFGHRRVFADDGRRGAALAPGFGERGWSVGRFVTMALGEALAPRRVVAAGASEIDVDEAIAFSRRMELDGQQAADEDVADQLARFRTVLHERAGARFFGARVDGELASACELYLRDGAAQIEDVNTLERFRGRGLAKTTVALAIAEAVAAGADLVWLIADDEDWPKDLYARIGFRPVDRVWQFTRVD